MARSSKPVGRPAYDSKQKLVAATCALLAERGYEATSPQMILQRAGIGQGSMYHHYRGKEDLAFDAIAHMRGRTTAFLEGQYDQLADTDGEAAAVTIVENALARLFARREGQALIRLLADPTVGAIKPLAEATRGWCDDIRAAVTAGLRGDAPGDDPSIAAQAAAMLGIEVEDTVTQLLSRMLGQGVLNLPRWTSGETTDE